MKKIYLVTGSRGFVGKHLCKYLKKIEPNSKIIELPKKNRFIKFESNF